MRLRLTQLPGGARPGDDEEVFPPPCIPGCFDLGDHFGGRDHFLAGKMSAPFGHHLVFQLDGIGPSTFKRPNSTPNIQRVSEASIRVNDNW
jgi:hypothetical protein